MSEPECFEAAAVTAHPYGDLPRSHEPRTAVSGGGTLAAVFEAAGLPAGVLSVPPGGVDVGETLVTHPDVHFIAFTGSTGAGRRVAELVRWPRR